MEPLAVSTKDAAVLMGVSELSVRRLIADGALPYVRIGQTSIRIVVEDIKAYLQQGRTTEWSPVPGRGPGKAKKD